ncbi:hypothetical protein HMPREF1624_08218 [Sporothrix schenckii ATCC 58251]|uniref:Uncharacterized protein n=1 Tax=Sporothrix schenckii (strain ATCC 58251 / de Perez 2211183) TaxID=1391915 RepID=U7PLC9_SPOS1|nr:hypothetical protein HMPREF1624_08218 [Sporothrix schenckii ATCC 58251]
MVPAPQTVFITGCSPGGIGNALAREFHARGCKVIASARRAEALTDLQALGLETVLLDVDDEASVEAAVKAVADRTGGRLDILVNNAGTTYQMPLADIELARLRALFETNLVAVVGLTNRLLPQLMAARGLVVNISSASESLPFPFKGAYAMTKAALASYSRTLSVEVAPFGVRVLNVTTAFVQSQLGKRTPPPAWPADSLYDSMRGLPQGAGSGPRMLPETYAARVVGECLKGPGWLEWGPWRFGGTRETMMLGTLSGPMWLLGFLGNNWARFFMLRKWKFSILSDALRRDKKTV